jgi:D-alanyl-D-alanine carboxypeptidase
MAELKAVLSRILTSAAAGRGAASVSVIDSLGRAYGAWVPETTLEPAFLAYSITKTFTAALILKLCEERTLALEDRLASWFPDIANADRISIRQLLNHTSGIPDYGGIRKYHEDVRSSPSVPWTFERFAAETFRKGLLFDPGAGWAYSNVGYMLVKRIAEDVTAKSYRALIADLVFPLGLKRTFVAESLDDLATLAPGTSFLLSPDGSPREARTHYHPGWVSHGVVASTASECILFMDALFKGHVISRDSLREMLELVDLSDGPDGDSPLRAVKPGYGLGVMGDPESPWGRAFGHNGGGPCYSASAFHTFDHGGFSVCAMAAIEGFSPEQVVATVLDSGIAGK